jgi:hypothetical protein
MRSLSKEKTRLDYRLIQMESKGTIEFPDKEKEPSELKDINLN